MPAELEQLVLACLKKNPRERPMSAAAVREALEPLRMTTTWSATDADAWWASSAPAALASARVKEASVPHSPPRPQTLAIDWAARHAVAGEA